MPARCTCAIRIHAIATTHALYRHTASCTLAWCSLFSCECFSLVRSLFWHVWAGYAWFGKQCMTHNRAQPYTYRTAVRAQAAWTDEHCLRRTTRATRSLSERSNGVSNTSTVLDALHYEDLHPVSMGLSFFWLLRSPTGHVGFPSHVTRN